MAECLKCGAAAEFPFRVLEVQTLHIRDLGGEKRVQALGLFQDYAICRDCAQAYLDRLAQRGGVGKKLLPFLLVLLFGIIVSILCWSGATALRVMGLAAILCGIAGSVTTLQAARKKRAEFSKLPPEEQLYQAAWECLLEVAPRKDGDNDLTYIPVTPQTLKLKNGDLMIVYDLLPAVAKKAWDLLHGME